MTISTNFADYHHRISLNIRFADMDSLGHVNNAKYLTYIEVGRLQYFYDLNVFRVHPEPHVGSIVARTALDYRLPLTLADNPLTIYTRCSKLGNKSYEMEHLIVRNNQDIAAEGHIVLVAFDYHINQSVAVPDEWRKRIMAYEPAMSSVD
ncbi:MAG: thioesterase family protein [Anaerolineae bacterium]